MDCYDLVEQLQTQELSSKDLATHWNISSQEASLLLKQGHKLSTSKALPDQKVIKELEKITNLSRKKLLNIWIELDKKNFEEMIKFTPRMKESAKLFDLDFEEFVLRLQRSNFTPSEYYKRVNYLKNKKSIWTNPKLLSQSFKEFQQKSTQFFTKNFDKYVLLSDEFSELKKLLKEAPNNGERALIATKYSLSLPPKKAKQLYYEIRDGFQKAQKKLWKNIIQTRLINMPDFKKVVAISLIADNGSLMLTHAIKVGLENLEGLATDIGAFSIIEILLSMTTIKEAAMLEAFPHLLKKSQEAAKKISPEQVEELSKIRKSALLLKKLLRRSKEEISGVIKDGASLGVQTALIGFLPMSVGHMAMGLTGKELLNESLMMSGLIGIFFATSSNIRYQIVNRLLIPMLPRVPRLGTNDKARTTMIFLLTSANMFAGSYTWYMYKDYYQYLREKSEE